MGVDVQKWIAITRPIVTFLLVATSCYLAVIGQLEANKSFLALTTTALVFWFTQRTEEKKQ